MLDNLKVGIYIPTLNKPDFVIRQIKYYASLNSPHPVYIGDNSNEENAKILQNKLQSFKNKLQIHYFHYQPAVSQVECEFNLVSNIKERYAIFSGDDDFLVPDSLTKCANFLEKNPDYALASGLAVSIKLNQPGPYGEIADITDYRRPEVLEEKAEGRLKNFLNRYHVTLFSVTQTEDLKREWGLSLKAKEHSFQTEVMPCSLAILRGKSKTLNYLGIVRQMHDTRQASPSVSDWIAKADWPETYQYFSEILEKEISLRDKIEQSSASKAVKEAMENYIHKHLSSAPTQSNKNRSLKLIKKIMTKIPLAKKIFYQHLNPNKAIHYQVLQPWSKYYKDFQPIIKVTKKP